MGVFSNLNVPRIGSYVVYGCSETFECGFFFVKMLKIVDFPVFGGPQITHCISAFFIPCLLPLPLFFLFSALSLNFFNLDVRFFNIFSDDLCLGHSFIIISKQVILSPSVVAFRKSSSAL